MDRRSGASFTAFAAVLLLSTGSIAQEPASLTFEQLEGWWRSPLEHEGQASEAFLHFVEENGKLVAGVSLPDIGAWDFRFNDALLSGNRVELSSLKLPLAYDAASQTLNGVLPPSLVPVYSIALHFKRIPAPPAPAEPAWNYPQPAIAWTRELGSPVWAALDYDPRERILFVGTDSGTLHAIDARDGTSVWSVDAAGKIRARPVFADGAVYLSADDGFLYKFDAHRATERWRVRIDTSPDPRRPRGSREAGFDRYGSAPLVDRDRLYVGSRDGHLYAIDVDTGRILWQAVSQGMITATPVRKGAAVIFGSHDGRVYAVDAASGRNLWQHDAQGAVATDMTDNGNRSLIGTRSYDLRALDARNGRRLWNYYYWFSWVDSGPTIVDGTAYVGSSDEASIFAFDMASGRKLWQRRTNGWCWPTPLVIGQRVYAAMVGGDAVFTTRRGALVALDRADGRIVWAYVAKAANPKDPFGFASTPVVTGEYIYAADAEGRLFAFKT